MQITSSYTTTLHLQMQHVANQTRSNDTGGLKHKISLYAPHYASTQGLGPRIKGVKDKSERGFAHLQLAYLLCPIKYVVDFDADPAEYVAAITAATTKLWCYHYY